MLRVKPPPPLDASIEWIWDIEDAAPEQSTVARVLPDGLTSLALPYGSRLGLRQVDGEATRHAGAVVVGPQLGPYFVEATGRVSLVLVQFRPGGLPSLLDVPPGELVSCAAPLDVLVDRRTHAVLEALADVHGPRARIAITLRWLSELFARARPGASAPCATFLAAVAAIEASRGRIRMARLTEVTGASRRHLSRLFLKHVGLSPSKLARIARFQHAVEASRHGLVSLGDVAHAAGYADQAHMTREFAELAGAPPARLWREAADVSVW